MHQNIMQCPTFFQSRSDLCPAPPNLAMAPTAHALLEKMHINHPRNPPVCNTNFCGCSPLFNRCGKATNYTTFYRVKSAVYREYSILDRVGILFSRCGKAT